MAENERAIEKVNTEAEAPLYHKHISAEHRLLDLKLEEVFHYRDLIILFVKRSFRVSYKQTILGPLWLFINPLLTAIMQLMLFTGIAGLSTDGIPAIVFYLTSTALWGYFASCVKGNSATFTNNARLFGKVYFPRLTIPLANVLSAIIKLGIQMLLILCFMVYYMLQGRLMPDWRLLWVLPLVVLQLGMLGMGAGILVSSMTTKYRDLSVLVGFGINLWMYGTPVVYPLSMLHNPALQTLVRINPVSAPMELFRSALLGKGTVLWGNWGITWGVTVVVLALGIVVFNLVERDFMDHV